MIGLKTADVTLYSKSYKRDWIDGMEKSLQTLFCGANIEVNAFLISKFNFRWAVAGALHSIEPSDCLSYVD